jgi:hypothetical protein
MTDSEHDNFQVGEDVIIYVNRDHVRGKVAKVTPARVTVSYGASGVEVFHRRKYGRPFECRRVTAADRAREAFEADLKAWDMARPTLEHLKLRRFYVDGDVHVGMPREPMVTLDALEQIADEAHAIREWLRKRPKP